MELFEIFVNAETTNPTFADWVLYTEEAIQFYLEEAGLVESGSVVTVAVWEDSENPELPASASVLVDDRLKYRADITEWSVDPETKFPAFLMKVSQTS